MATDTFGQGVPITLLTDGPNANTLASGIVQALAQRSVMRFSSGSARAATLTAPVGGMVAWLDDARRLELYDGAAWLTLAYGAPGWTTLGLVSGYSHDGNSNGTVQWRVTTLAGQDFVQWRGGLNVSYSGSSIANGGYFNSSFLPTSARPSSLRTVSIGCSVASSDSPTLKLDAQVSGDLQIVGTQAGRTPPWVSLNGVMYSL
ncbi:hypothetical protein AABB02_33415 [Streptomyces rimosus]|uniref:hypothetical protein n=1 Tax=Streptomyces rimosus TaxID=1927 RepID=UPI0031D4B1FA